MARTKKGAILCPNCRNLISVNEHRCPHCGLGHPGSWWKSNRWTQGYHSIGQIIKAIIYANVILYLISLLLYPRGLGFSLNPFLMLSPDGRSIKLLGATGLIPITYDGSWWTLVSANYLHGSIFHIGFNMFALLQIGSLIIEEYGGYRMFVIYTLGGIGGSLVSYIVGVPYTIGASGAVCSLIGAALYYGKSRGGAYGQFLYRQIGSWALGIFIFGFLVPGINNWGHGGGMLTGVLLGLLLGYHEKKREGLVHKLLAGGCVVITVVILGWAIGHGIYIWLQGSGLTM